MFISASVGPKILKTDHPMIPEMHGAYFAANYPIV
jgi:hypothetical protein